MSLNAKPKMLFNNVFTLGIPTATNTDSGSEFDVLNIRDYKYNTLWKAASVGVRNITVDLNLILNAGFETGDFTNWDQNEAEISASHVGGSWSCKIIATGAANVSGARTDIYSVDPTKIYVASGWNKAAVFVKGDYRFRIIFLDNTDTIIGDATDLETFTALQTDWLLTEKYIGPAGSGSDIEFPAGTAGVQFDNRWSNGTSDPEGTGHMDDVLFYRYVTVNAFTIANHNLWSANAEIRVLENHDTDETPSIFNEILSVFTPSNDKAFIQAVTETIGSRAFRIEIETDNIVPYFGMLWLGDIFTFEKYALPFDPDPETLKSETTKSMEGFPLGTNIDYYTRMIDVNFKNLSDTWILNTFPALWAHLRQGLPVVWVWDITNHEDQVYIGSVPPKFRKSTPYTPITRTLNIKLDTIVEE